jgi:hypothetical protein
MREVTPELVEQRLSQLRELSRLGDSLLDARLPPIDRTTLARRGLILERLVPGPMIDPRDVHFVAAGPGVDRHLGWVADAWVDTRTGRIVHAGHAVLVGASIEGRPCDLLPRGQSGIVTLRCLEDQPDWKLPLLLCKRRDHERTSW